MIHHHHLLRRRGTGIAVLAVAGLLAACSGGDEPGAASSETTSPPAAPAETSTTLEEAEPEDSHVQGSVDVDLEQPHSEGAVAEVTEVAAEGNAIYVGVNAVNLTSNLVALRPNPDFLYLLIDGEQRLKAEMTGETENWRLSMEPGEELTARLAFIGRIPSPDSTVELFINYRDGEPYPSDGSTPYPSFHFELPNPGASS